MERKMAGARHLNEYAAQGQYRPDKSTFSRDAVKPFELVKYFTFISLIVIFTGTLVLSFIITQRVRTVLLRKSEAYAILLGNNLNHQINMQFLLPTYFEFGKIQLRNKVQFDRMDEVVRSTLHGFNVDNVHIYDENDIISYSFDLEKVGKQATEDMDYREAFKGESVSRLVQRGSLPAILLGIPTESILRTYTPLVPEKVMERFTSPVLGVLEIVQDLSDDYSTIFWFQIVVISASTCVMGLLFLILRFVVQRGEAILWQRAEERLRLEEQLSRAERLASLGQMAATISHEIRNPLGIIRSSAELLKKRGSACSRPAKLEEVIIEESTRLNEIITDFLTFARPQKPAFAPCRVEDVLEKNLAFLDPRLKEEGYTLNKHFGDGLPVIRADGNLLYQAFLNILINAMQATPGGGVITVQVTAEGDRVRIVFSDKGPGIDEASLQKIWNPFFTTKERGTGLGLAVVKNIVDAHHGNVRMENAPSGGARIVMELPIGAYDGNDSHR